MKKRIFSIALLSPTMAKWKINLFDTLLESISFLRIGAANRLGRKHSNLKNVDFGNAALKDLNIDVVLNNKAALPKTGAVTIVANHPGGADVLATVTALGRERADTVILANRLICIDPVKDMVIPVDVMSQRKVDLNDVDRAYQDGKVIVFYAAGKNSRFNQDGILRDRRWRTTFLELAKKYDTPICVLKIEGQNSPLFYKVSKFRERNAWLKNVPLENFFQLREIIDTKGRLDMFLSEPISSNIVADSNRQAMRGIADRLYNFLYAMNANHLDFEKYEASIKSEPDNG